MTSKINAITTGAGGIEVTGDSSGQIEFQADGTTVATLTTSGLDVSSGLTFGSPIDIASGGTGQTTASDARTALGLAIGTDVQAYDVNTAKYNDTTANFTGTLQNGGVNVLNANSTLSSSNLSGALPAIDGSALTGISTNPYTAQSLSGSGYITLVGGLKINWVTTGTTTATSGTTGFTWASAFTTIYGAVVSQSLGTDSGEIGVNKSTTGGTVDFYAWSGGSKQWTIIGIGV